MTGRQPRAQPLDALGAGPPVAGVHGEGSHAPELLAQVGPGTHLEAVPDHQHSAAGLAPVAGGTPSTPAVATRRARAPRFMPRS